MRRTYDALGYIISRHGIGRRLPFPGSYLFALLMVAAAALLRLWMPGSLSSTPFLAFYPALVLAAAFGGFGPGTLAVLFSWLCVTLYFDSTPGFIGLSNPAELSRLLVFFSGGLGVSLICEAQLRAKERILQQARDLEELGKLINLAPFMIRDEQDRIVHWSDGCSRLYGYSREQALGSVSQTLLKTQLPESLDKIRDILCRKGEWEGEVTHVRSNGSPIIVASLWILSDHSGTPVVLEMSNDITRLKATEEALLRTSQELARSNRDLESFAYVASHDLQEPLRTIAGFLQLLEQKSGNQLEGKAKQYIQFAVDGSKRMHQMITDLLFYSKVGMQAFEFRPVNLREPVEQSIASLRKSIEDSGAAIAIGDLPSVRADATQMLQVFQNLLSNAIKFRSERLLEIKVGSRREFGFWKIWVKDNGIGLENEQRDRIFEVFQRLHSRQKYSGSGIGLSICKKIIERHGGNIWVESEPDSGSTFYFTLPSD